MEKVIDKALVRKLIDIEGKARGVNLKNDGDFVLKNEGEQGLKRLEKELEELGCPLGYEKIKTYDFYPVGMRAVSLLAIKKIFDLDDDGIRKVCGFTTYISVIVKIYIKFFHSPETLMAKAPKIWQEHFSQGKLDIVDYDFDKKYGVLRIRDFKVHPIFCRCLEGYFRSVAAAIIPTDKPKSAVCREVKCVFKGDKFHEFLVKWK